MKKRLFSVVALLLGVSLPFTALAATTLQQRFDQALRTYVGGPQSVALQFSFDLEERITALKEVGDKVAVDVTVHARAIPSGVAKDSEGNVRVNRIKGMMEGESFDFASPLSVAWKQVGGALYVRITELSPQVQSLLQDELEFDLDAAVGRWIQIPVADRLDAFLDVSALEPSGTHFIKQMLQPFTGFSVLRVTRTEKRWQNESGEQLVRVRAMVNPSVYPRLRTEILKVLDRSSSDYRATVQRIDKDLQEMRTLLSKVQFAFNMNETRGVIERSEIGMRLVEPMRRTTYTAAGRPVTRTIGQETVRVAVGVQSKAASSEPVFPPVDFMTFESLMEVLESEELSLLDGDAEVLTAP
jgi:hypothetical protein